jgi:hypothetical protein
VTAGYSKTKYHVTVVGPGAHTAVFDTLTNAQATAQLQVAVGGFVTDAMIPFLANFIFGSGFVTQESGGVSFESTWRTDLQTDMLNFLAGAPALQTQIMQGDYSGALAQVIDNIRQAGTLRDVVILSLQQAAGKQFTSAALAEAMQSINAVLNAAGGVLQIYDSSIMATQLLISDSADQWTIINGGQKVTLTPASSTLAQFGVGAQSLTVALPGLSDTTGYSYYWTNTGNAGDLSPADASQGPSTGFCSSDATATYVARISPVLQQSVSDKISVQAYSGGNCNAANLLGTAPTATLTVGPDSVTLSPASSTIQQAGQQTLTAAVTGGAGSNYSYRYTLIGAGGAATVGSISDGTNSGPTFCSASANVTYTPNATPTLTQNATDGITVQAFTGSGCVAAKSIGISQAAGITVAASGLLITPHNASTSQKTPQTFSATLTTASQGTTYSYQWSVAGSGGGSTLGTLVEPGSGGQTGASFCSASNSVSYTPNAAPVLSSPASDTISLQAFSAAGCVAANAVSGVVSTTATVTPSPTVRDIPLSTVIYSVMQASDGNYYSSNYGLNCVSAVQNNSSFSCGDIYKITPSGTQTLLYHFPSDQSSGVGPGMLLEGPDGKLYGLTEDGIFFSLSLSGQFTALTGPSTTTVTQVGGTQQNLLLGSDGFFYGVQGSSIYRFSTSGGFSIPYSLSSYGGSCSAAPNPAVIQDLIEGGDGNFYVALAADCPYFDQNNGGAIVRVSRSGGQSTVGIAPYYALTGIAGTSLQSFRGTLAQGADSSLYYVAAFAYSAYEDVIRFTPDGSFQPIYQLQNPNYNSPYNLQSGLELASDGNLYGFGTISTPGNGTAASPCNPTTGAGCFYIFQISTSGGYNTLYSFGGGSEGYYPGLSNGVNAVQPGIQNNLGDLVGGAAGDNSGDAPLGVIYDINNHLPPPVQLFFSQSPATVNQPVTLTWSVPNAFSLTSQQCYAFIQGGAPGAGAWTDKQYGNVSATGYNGSSVITPTAPGTYTYALTCAGTQSGFATLTVH